MQTHSTTRLLVTIAEKLTIRCRDEELIRLADLHTKHMHINGLISIPPVRSYAVPVLIRFQDLLPCPCV